MVIEVNKDIDRYQESVAMGLTARQLIFSIASVVVGGGIVLLLYKYIGLTGSAYVAIPCVAPIALGGFYSFNGMNFYEYMGKKLHFMFGNKALTYVSTEGEPAIKQLEVEQNEQVKKKGRKAEPETSIALGFGFRCGFLGHGRWRYRPSSLQVYWSYGFCLCGNPVCGTDCSWWFLFL